MLARSVEVIAHFDKKGIINPIKIKLEEDDETNVIKVVRVVKRDYEKLAGNHMWKLTCISLINGIERQYVLKYDLMDCKWIVFM